jgi:hypothetical protein
MLVCETDDPFPCEGRVKLFGKSLSHAGHGLCLDMHCECPFLAEDCLLQGFYEGLPLRNPDAHTRRVGGEKRPVADN